MSSKALDWKKISKIPNGYVSVGPPVLDVIPVSIIDTKELRSFSALAFERQIILDIVFTLSMFHFPVKK